MKLKKLKLKNFLTYDNFEYKFEDRPLLIQGLNLTDENQKTNGTGKSGLQTGIEFCMTASNSRGVNDKELITYGFDESEVELFSECEQKKQELHIKWIIRKKGANKLFLKTRNFDGDWVGVEFSSILDGKDFIQKWFDISKEDLFNYFLINKLRFKSFFKSSNREKIDLINRFSDASILDGIEKIETKDLELKYNAIKTKIEGKDETIEDCNSKIEVEKNRDFRKELEEKKQVFHDDIDDIELENEDLEKDIVLHKSDCNELLKNIDSTKDSVAEININKRYIEKEILEIREKVNHAEKHLHKVEEIENKYISKDWSKEREKLNDESEENEDKLNDTENENDELLDKARKIDIIINKISAILAGAIKCPLCEGEFILGEDKDEIESEKKRSKKLSKLNDVILKQSKEKDNDILSIKQTIKNIDKKISNINNLVKEDNDKKNELTKSTLKFKVELSEIVRKLDRLENELESEDLSLTRKNDNITSFKNDIKNEKDKIDIIKTSIKHNETKIKELGDKIKLLKVSSNKSNITLLETQISEANVSKIDLEEEYVKVGEEINFEKEWSNNFKQFKTYLANKSLDIISYHCNRYLEDMGSDIRVKFNGYKVLADGSIREEITATIFREIERTFASFSGGEQGRLLFASILANRYMINSTHKYGGLDYLSVDEIFEGVDDLGLKHLINSAKTLNIAMMIITHVSLEETSEDTLLIVKENGISRIKK